MELLEIHDAYYHRLKRFILSMVKDPWVADDLVQETFLRVGRKKDSLRDPAKLSPWIYRIAWNLCQDYFKSRHHVTVDDNTPTKEVDDQIQIHHALEQQQMGRCVQEKMNRLPDTLKVPLVLFDMEGFTHGEIAEILDISVENAKVRLHRARSDLKKILDRECEFERDNRGVFVCTPANK